MTTERAGDLVVVADVHIGKDDPELADFCAFITARAHDTSLFVLLGDIFSLWLGGPQYTLPQHHAVLEACRTLRRAGVRVVFVEGNREFAVRRWEGDAFDEVGLELAEEAWAGRRWYFAHGDLLNRDDRLAAAFRRVVRSRAVLGTVGALPGPAGLAFARRVERALRHRNLRHKTSIPAERFARYAEWFAGRGFDAGVIGHVHVELRLDLPSPDGRGRALYVLPDWRTTRRYLRIPRAGEPRFEAWGGTRTIPPAVIEVRGSDRDLSLLLDRAADVAPGGTARVSSGHGDADREGRVLAVDGLDPRRVVVRLEPGPPVQVGDRVVFEALSSIPRENPS